MTPRVLLAVVLVVLALGVYLARDAPPPALGPSCDLTACPTGEE